MHGRTSNHRHQDGGHDGRSPNRPQLWRPQTTTTPTTTITNVAQTRARDIVLVGLAMALLLAANVESKAPDHYYGREIGRINSFGHGVQGRVYAVDESTLFVKGFAYDGSAPDAFFWVGNSPRPSPEGYIIPYPEEYTGREPPALGAHENSDIILKLPMGKRIRDIRWLSVWCRRFTVDFGEIFIPPGLEVPKPRVLPEFKRLAHGLRSSNISILDAKTFYIPNLHYDGAGPDAYFWVGNGSEPNIMGIKVPNEIGSLEPLRGYQGEDIEIQLPGNLTMYDIDWLAVWCVEYRHNFGHVYIPKDLDIPPALGQTKIATTSSTVPTVIAHGTTSKPKDVNCRELLPGKMNVKWAIVGEYVEIELNGRISEDQYMAFGISGKNGQPMMIGSDVVVAFYDKKQRRFRAEDYYISALSQCDGKHGVCPDERIGGKNDVEFVFGDRSHGVTTVKYRRLLQTNEPINDQAYPSDRQISVIAAVGPLNSQEEANAHNFRDVTADDIQINFSSKDDHTCKDALDSIRQEGGPDVWPTRVINGERNITAKIGPTGGKRGYTPLTGHPSWGIAWYLNDMLIPEVYVERGQTYTFLIEGGDDSTQPAKYHPFYITDSSEGGYGQLTDGQRRRETVYAGVDFDKDGYPLPTAAGRYCEWKHRSVDRSDEIAKFEDYMKTLYLACDETDSPPVYLNWTVADDTPDMVYYQCYTHRNLGWKIHVVNPGMTGKFNGSHGLFAVSSHSIALLVAAVVTSLLMVASGRRQF
ncbi:protein Skeletor, isoforms B/C isoform X2 [Culex quinquefasciatus]|uniref:protein Skeletor, isoforms B/C isoform X2 n=1 Tax=Culex quinquefasciatus TaxID=7176 RepID=UPI0018E3C1E9|nr:protein Skeletor, isoforms B/C isoform X2 [Culex quinquefasciatus]